MASVYVDPEVLRRFAHFTQGASDVLASTSVAGPLWSAQSAMPGSELDVLCGRMSDVFTAGILGMAQRLDVVAQSARGASLDYSVTESEFAARLRVMGALE
ncbi:MAG: hypothetical protein WBD41_27640 [Rhodococcus sp. (in: high G+C Gram-positive bacteria)]